MNRKSGCAYQGLYSRFLYLCKIFLRLRGNVALERGVTFISGYHLIRVKMLLTYGVEAILLNKMLT